MFGYSFIVRSSVLVTLLRPLIKALVVLGLIAVVYFIGCSETYFGTVKTVSCVDFTEKFGANNCRPAPDVKPEQDSRYLQFNYDVDLGEIDIIFVVDNSSSMHKEQKSIGKQMSNFLNKISHLDYRIAVTTTDISSSPRNPRHGQSYQDGNFISIGGRSYLENKNRGYKASNQDVQSFISAIERPESLACAKRSGGGARSDDLNFYFEHGYDHHQVEDRTSPTICPSHDERAIYALNLAVDKYSQNNFFRRDAHLMMVIISDEDERSSDLYIRQQLNEGISSYVFEEKDYPETLVETVYNRLGALKNFSVHSIIIPPGNSSCLNHQNKDAHQGVGTGRGYYGYEYARLSKASSSLRKYGNLLKGNVISICDRSYPKQLSKIALFAEVPRISLPCDRPEYIKIKENGRERNLDYDIEGRSLQIHPGEVYIGSKVTVTIVCEE